MDSFPTRHSRTDTFRLSEAAALLSTTEPAPDPDPSLRGIATLEGAGPEDLAPVGHQRYLPLILDSRAGALLVASDVVPLLPQEETRPRLVVPDVHSALRVLLEWRYPPRETDPRVHATAILGAGVALGDDVRIGPYAVVESDARLGDGVTVGAHTVVGAGARIGDRCILHPHVVVYPRSIVGNDVILHSGVRLGVDGFGYVFEDGEHRKVPQVGRCQIENGVEIGANTTLDRGSIDDTRIGTGSRIDNLVQIGHNVQVGPLSILVSQVGIAGSSRLGKGVVLGGQAGVAGHIEIGDGAQIAAQAGIISDVPAGETYMGFPGRPRTEFLRIAAAQGKIRELLRRVRALEEELKDRPAPEPEGDGSEAKAPDRKSTD